MIKTESTMRRRTQNYWLLIIPLIALGLAPAEAVVKTDEVGRIKQLLSEGKYKRAEAGYTRAITEGIKGTGKGTWLLSSHLGRATARMVLGDYDGAIADCDVVIAKNAKLIPPDSAYAVRGRVKALMGDREGALADYEAGLKRAGRGINDKGRTAEFYAERAYGKVLLDDLDGAISDLNTAASSYVGLMASRYYVPRKKTWRALSGALEKKLAGDQAGALSALAQARAHWPTGMLDLPVVQIISHFNQQEIDRQRQVIRQAQEMELAGQQVAALRLYGQAYGITNNPAQTNAAVKEIVRLCKVLGGDTAGLTEDGRRYVVQANTYLQAKRYAAAIDAYGEVIKASPCWPDAYFNRAHMFAHAKRYHAAITTMRHYLMLSPDATNARTAQDKIYEWEAA